MINDLKIGIIKTLAYFDIFDYPLTLSEIRKYNGQIIDMTDIGLLETVLSIPIIQESNGFYYFLGRSDIVASRQEKNNISPQKFGKALVLAKIISKIPTVEYIGVTGNLAMNSSRQNDDIELVIVASKNSLWTTNFLIKILLRVSKQGKSDVTKGSGNKIITHTFIDRSVPALPKKSRNLYFAHMLVNLRTLYSKNEAESELMHSNRWILDFLPNSQLPHYKKKRKAKAKFVLFSKLFNYLFFKYSKNRVSKTILVKVKSKFVIFESVNREKLVLDLYNLKIKKYLALFEDDLWIESEEAKFYLDEKKVRILN